MRAYQSITSKTKHCNLNDPKKLGLINPLHLKQNIVI
uniref:Uncharacterized protein n=1 Tax=Lymantria dispar multicapsid nuclear polyhedrosis virus TaxID=10449 RepID=A0A4Y5X3L8_NPVLD|nr:hypothetical protein LdMNPV-J2_00010 [Lymantria dispar multiple nucleopolyhedrovirus]